jgi:Tol biopolymer transport system component
MGHDLEDAVRRRFDGEISALPLPRAAGVADVRARAYRRRARRSVTLVVAAVVGGAATLSVSDAVRSAAQDGRHSIASTAGERAGSVVFARSAEADGSDSNLALLEPSGSLQELTADHVWEGDPSASPDGRLVAFERATRSGIAIVVRDLVTTEETYVTDGSSWATSPAWSPDGAALAFAEGVTDRGAAHIFVVDLATNERTRVTSGATQDADPSFSPDGRRLAFSRLDAGRTRIVVHDLDSDTEMALVVSPTDPLQPAWSPDGRRIAFIASSTSIRDANAIYVYHFATDEASQLVDSAIHQGAPAWSGDGSWIVFYEHSDHPDLPETPRPMFDVFVMRADGTEVTKLTDLRQPTFPHPSWL